MCGEYKLDIESIVYNHGQMPTHPLELLTFEELATARRLIRDLANSGVCQPHEIQMLWTAADRIDDAVAAKHLRSGDDGHVVVIGTRTTGHLRQRPEEPAVRLNSASGNLPVPSGPGGCLFVFTAMPLGPWSLA